MPALDRGLIEAAEFNNASSDRALGFPEVAKNCMLQSFHQSGEQFEVLFNKSKYNALPQELKSIIDYAVQAASADFTWKSIDRNSKDYIELKTKDHVAFYKTPAGKKMVAQEPAAIKQSLDAAQDWANKFSDTVLDRFRTEMAKKGHKL